MKTFGVGAVLAIGVVLALAGPIRAQNAFVPTGPLEVMEPSQNWGNLTNAIVNYEASDFELFTGTFGGIDGTTAARFCGAGGCAWFVGVKLPAGALMSSVEIDACDTSATEQVAVAVFRTVKAVGTTTAIAPFVGTGVAAVPGCAVFNAPLTANETIDNLNNTYFIDVQSGSSSATRFKSVRVNYRLQVSPAPATATFSDVPVGTSQFRFVEALAAAGITGGCGGGNYCPNDPVTRGQMAVFLSVSLGLHFPN